MKKDMTALVRTTEGNLKIMRDDWFTNQKDFADELKANGYRILKVWTGNKTHDEVMEWEFLNRKKAAFKKSMYL